jgi:predicted 3-demethylubiquinone-9 3-methyltransferase (glyoxalase superfamily)
MQFKHKIVPCLWFDSDAEEAANFYVGIFPDSRITNVTRYAQDVYDKPKGSVLTVAFELDDQSFTALNGGPVFKFNEAVSLQILCDSQQEVDHYWGGSRPAGTRGRSNAAGSRTAMVCRGRWCRPT